MREIGAVMGGDASAREAVRMGLVRSARAMGWGGWLVIVGGVVGCGPAVEGAVPVVAVAGTGDGVAVVEPMATAEAPTPAKVAAIAWETSELDARERAKAQRRPLVIFVFAQWATAAARMDRLTWTDPRVIERVRSFIPLRIDLTDADVNAQAGADAFDLDVMPSTLVLDDKGHEMARLEGFAGPDEVLSALTRLEMVGD